MTTPESPSALLERAAALIEQRERLAVIGPWSTAGPRVSAGRDEDWHVADCHTSTTAAWIAMLNPSVASPLVEWLRHDAAGARTGYFDPSEHALTFARIVLGEPE